MRTVYVVLCPKSWRDGLASETADGVPVEVDIRTPAGCYGYLPIFETLPAAQAWSGGLFEVVEFMVYSSPAASAAVHAAC
jgi:hypothetical protein